MQGTTAIRMKVLFMTNIPAPYRVDFFNELGKLCDLTVTFQAKTMTDRNDAWGSNNFRHFKAIFLHCIHFRKNYFFCPEIVTVIKQGFDKIIIGGYSSPTDMLAIEYMRLHNIPFYIEADGGLIAQDSFFKYIIKKHFISSASGWFSSGKTTTRYFAHYGAKESAIFTYSFSSLKKSDILTSVLRKSEKEQIRKELCMQESKIVISVGQFIYRKGFDILLNAWKRCPKEWGLYIIGAEPTDEYLSIKEKLQLKNVTFVGFKTKEKLKKYYYAADLFAFATREDIWGLVINEAMASALPIVTTERCVAGLELVENGVNGYIVPVEEETALFDSISEILQNDKLRQKMAWNNLKRIKNWTIENMAKQHYRELKK